MQADLLLGVEAGVKSSRSSIWETVVLAARWIMSA